MREKNEIVRAIAQTNEDRILLAQTLDKLATCQDRSYQTNTKFLDMRERTLVAEAVRLAGGTAQMAFAGGYEEAERVCAVFFPDYLTAEDALREENTPICAIRAEKSPADTLAHRDYLGALMGLGLQRTSVGDIFVHETGADILVLCEVREFLLLEFAKAGRKRLELSGIPLQSVRRRAEIGEEKEGSVASPRLDSVTALIFGVSRSEAQTLISRGQVFLNFMQCEKDEKEVGEGDRITVRGMGRARIIAFSGVSRKGRVFLRFSRSK